VHKTNKKVVKMEDPLRVLVRESSCGPDGNDTIEHGGKRRSLSAYSVKCYPLAYEDRYHYHRHQHNFSHRKLDTVNAASQKYSVNEEYTDKNKRKSTRTHRRRGSRR